MADPEERTEQDHQDQQGEKLPIQTDGQGMHDISPIDSRSAECDVARSLTEEPGAQTTLEKHDDHRHGGDRDIGGEDNAYLGEVS